MEAEQAEMRQWQARRQQLRSQEWEFRERLIEKAKEMLEQPLVETRQKELENGNLAVVTLPARWSFRDAATYIQLADRLGQNATGSQIAEIEALTTLINAGWLPQSLLDFTADHYFEMKFAIQTAFEKAVNAAKISANPHP